LETHPKTFFLCSVVGARIAPTVAVMRSPSVYGLLEAIVQQNFNSILVRARFTSKYDALMYQKNFQIFSALLYSLN